MNDDDLIPSGKPGDGGPTIGCKHRGWLLKTLSVSALVTAGVVGLAACGSGPASPGVASAGSTTTTTPPSSAGGSGSATAGGAESRLLKYSQCMRAHGITDYPDPSSNGSVLIHIQPGSDLNPHAPQNLAAQNDCKALRPGGNPTPAQEAAANANALKFTHCMQSNGIADFPEPNGQGTLVINVGGDIEPNSTRFKAAEKACKSLDTGFNTNENNLSPPPATGPGSTGQ
jgi:hypothetical protein